ncbi:MAG TPA: hypothetical protein VHD61_15795 [Lacunisphaera sp.]|nr:hypothetical protein [Lacunisphaera sp.]
MDAEKRGLHPTADKVSLAKSIGFRPGALRGKIEALYVDLLQVDPGIKLSVIIRDGFAAFWPQIEAYLRARHQSQLPPDQLTRLVLICSKATEIGVSVDVVENALQAAIADKLAAESTVEVR